MTLQGGNPLLGGGLGITGLDYVVVTAFSVTLFILILKSRRVGPLILGMAGFYLVIWFMAIVWGPLLLKGVTTVYALAIAAAMLAVWRKQSPQPGPGGHQ